MPSWEFHYESLAGGSLAETQDRYAALGRQGWEPVGPVSLLVESPGHSGAYTPSTMMMFKRPLTDGPEASAS